ncbi:MAG: hypothetical protein ACTSRW_06510 [Candidatus Helarchaeota archaeon]
MDSYEVSLKNDIVPAIAEKLNRQVDPRKLFTLSVDALDLIFGYLFQDSNVPPSDIVEILNSTDNQDEILRKLQEAAASVSVMPDAYDEREDIIAGIMAGIIGDFIGHDLRNEIEKRLRDEKDINKLIEYSQMSLNHLEIALGIRPPPYIPPEESNRVVAVPSPRTIHPDIPDEPVPPVTPMNGISEPEPVPFLPSAPPDTEEDTQEQPERVSTDEALREASELLKKRKEEAKKFLGIIRKKLEKVKINPDDLAEELDIIERIHPERLDRITKIMEKAKKKVRIKQLFDWLVISQQIEEIDVLVTHWQGIVGGSGAFRAAIPFARYDAMLTDIHPKLLEEFISRAKKAVYEIHNATDVNDRYIAVEEIKELAADLMRKALYG